MRSPIVLFDIDRRLVDDQILAHLAKDLERGDAETPWLEGGRARARPDGAAARAVAAALEGVHVGDFAAAYGASPIQDEVGSVVERLWSMGCETGIASGGPADIAHHVAASLGLDHTVAAGPETHEGPTTAGAASSTRGGLCGAAVCKGRALDQVRTRQDAVVTIAVGDGTDDACMLEAADIAIALAPADDAAVRAADVVLEDIADVPDYVQRQLEMLPY